MHFITQTSIREEGGNKVHFCQSKPRLFNAHVKLRVFLSYFGDQGCGGLPPSPLPWQKKCADKSEVYVYLW